jgi:transcriptional regulator with XRE-family HTH domain
VTAKSQPEGVVFGQRLRELRTERGLSQNALADLCGSNHPFISELERGVKVPSLTMILRLAEALECRPSELIKIFDRRAHGAPKSRKD